MNEHTAGPWHVQRYSGGHQLYVNAAGAQIALILHTETRGLADMVERRDANAAFIANAPETAAERDRLRAVNAELAVACDDLLNACDVQMGIQGISSEVLSAMERARTIIVKWIGEQNE